jgi:hypothetical protein
MGQIRNREMRQQHEIVSQGQVLTEKPWRYRGSRHEYSRPKSAAGIGYTGNG